MPPGLINLTIAERTIYRGTKSGFMVALGTIIIEFLYTFLAVYFIDFFIKNEIVGRAIKIGAIILFVGLAIYYFLKKVEVVNKVKRVNSNGRDFGLGLGVASMNMLILPFWIFVGLWLKANGYAFPNLNSIILFALGSTSGAFLSFTLYIRLGRYIVNHMQKVALYTNRILGALFLLLALVQIIRIFY